MKWIISARTVGLQTDKRWNPGVQICPSMISNPEILEGR
jgi:hypothetical protein